jgi:hypothetical protein
VIIFAINETEVVRLFRKPKFDAKSRLAQTCSLPAPVIPVTVLRPRRDVGYQRRDRGRVGGYWGHTNRWAQGRTKGRKAYQSHLPSMNSVSMFLNSVTPSLVVRQICHSMCPYWAFSAWARLIFCPFSFCTLEWDNILKNLDTLPVLSKNPGHTKNEQYYWKTGVVTGKEWCMLFILIEYNYEWKW